MEIVEGGTKFPQGKSGNKRGRPKGSKNKITLMKLMAEEAVRSDNAEGMLEVCTLIVEQAKNGDKPSQKLVWETVMSKGIADTQEAKEHVSINIGVLENKEKPIEGVIVEETDNEAIK